MKKWIWMAMVAALLAGGSFDAARAQGADEDAAPSADLVDADGKAVTETGTADDRGAGFWSVVFSSSWLGIMLWFTLFSTAGAAVYFVVDCAITVRTKTIMPQSLIDNVTASMAEGDVLKALQNCENEPGPMANVLSAGFSHVEEGYDVIQESIATAADLETEKIMQKLTWLSVCSNIAPMLGLLGTVQGMIGAFANLSGGAPDIGVLALQIAQALYTTAAGLVISVPCVTVYYSFRNKANKIILRMEAMTMELIKDLRNVEVVQG